MTRSKYELNSAKRGETNPAFVLESGPDTPDQIPPSKPPDHLTGNDVKWICLSKQRVVLT